MDKEHGTAVELRALRKLLTVGLLMHAVSTAGGVYWIWDDIQENRERRLGITFYDQAETLSKSSEWDELIELARNRQRERPRDPKGYFYEGMALYYKGQYKESIALFEKTTSISPSAKKNSDVWIKAARENIDKAAQGK